jgi:hypothetical protein
VPVADGPGFMARWAAAGVVGQVRAALTRRIRRETDEGPMRSPR